MRSPRDSRARIAAGSCGPILSCLGIFFTNIILGQEASADLCSGLLRSHPEQPERHMMVAGHREEQMWVPDKGLLTVAAKRADGVP